MTAKEIEHAAYVAAHRILEADVSAPELVCDGAIRTHAVDVIANIIREAIDSEVTGYAIAESGPASFAPRQAGFGKYSSRGTLAALAWRASS